jgi:hypothetical protein
MERPKVISIEDCRRSEQRLRRRELLSRSRRSLR